MRSSSTRCFRAEAVFEHSTRIIPTHGDLPYIALPAYRRGVASKEVVVLLEEKEKKNEGDVVGRSCS